MCCTHLPVLQEVVHIASSSSSDALISFFASAARFLIEVHDSNASRGNSLVNTFFHVCHWHVGMLLQNDSRYSMVGAGSEARKLVVIWHENWSSSFNQPLTWMEVQARSIFLLPLAYKSSQDHEMRSDHE
jgi:hypothetical protein